MNSMIDTNAKDVLLSGGMEPRLMQNSTFYHVHQRSFFGIMFLQYKLFQTKLVQKFKMNEYSKNWNDVVLVIAEIIY